MDARGPDFVQHIPRLRRYARALTGDRGRADDLVQDTLERALVKFHLWRPGSDLRAWMFTIMHNVYINQVRANSNAIISALDDQESRNRATEAGATSYYTKPFSPIALLKEIERLKNLTGAS